MANTTKQENTATILAALRMFQERYEDKDAAIIRQDWPEHFEYVDPLSTEDIDVLCEEINLGTPAPESAAKHTPGPWRQTETYNEIVAGPSVDPVHIATLDIGPFGAKNTRTQPGDVVANAHLIALSPELYSFAALIARMKTEEEFGDDAPPSEDWISTLNDLIAQARELCAATKG